MVANQIHFAVMPNSNDFGAWYTLPIRLFQNLRRKFGRRADNMNRRCPLPIPDDPFCRSTEFFTAKRR